MIRRVLTRWWWLALVAVAASACNASFEVDVMVEADGSGLVITTSTIDAETAAQLLDLEADANGLVLADLAQAGWDVERPEVGADGTVVLQASKAFGTPEQFTEVMNELNGPDGPFQEFFLIRTKRFARVDYRIVGTIDTSGDLAAFGDPQLEQLLGRSLNDIAETYEGNGDEIAFSFEITLPGELQGERPTRLLDTPEGVVAARWQSALGDNTVEPLALSTSTSNDTPRILIGVAILLAVLAALIVFAQVLRVVLPDRRRGRSRPQRPRPQVVAEEPAAVTTGPVPVLDTIGKGEQPFAVVSLDAMGVLYRHGHDVDDLLIPFIREKGSHRAGAEEITARARALDLGRITTHQFWELVGVPGDPARLDAEYVARHQLTPGVVRYLRTLREHGIHVACLANVSAAWASMLKAGHSLDGLVDTWVVSGSVGARKPDTPMFEVLRRLTEATPSAIQVIDDDLDVLDAARDLGFATTWFAPDGNRDDSRDHPMIRNFGSLDDEPIEPEAVPRADLS
ncbi:MAG: HAD family hydrolase [Actinomycetota bacterium]